VALQLYADDNAYRYPKAGGNGTPYWVDLQFRNTFNTNYRISRVQFYCPSNPSWNRDDFWSWPGNQYAVMGYLYFGGEPSYENNAGLARVNPPLPKPIFALKNTDRPAYTLLIVDLVRKLEGSWLRPGDSDPLVRGVNHFTPNGRMPEGANQGFLDGHVAWIKAKDPWIRYPKLTFGSTEVFFYGSDAYP
jgi:prepilin-type processing-associated H-X9-DG protein